MNFSRIAGGLHWFWDVFTGMLIGLIVAILVWKFKNTKFLQSVAKFFIKLASYFKL
jgi:membrane-associated phospholipid phosphatase